MRRVPVKNDRPDWSDNLTVSPIVAAMTASVAGRGSVATNTKK